MKHIAYSGVRTGGPLIVRMYNTSQLVYYPINISSATAPLVTSHSHSSLHNQPWTSYAGFQLVGDAAQASVALSGRPQAVWLYAPVRGSFHT
jgi:formylmethanofuran dehydrogenase subunit A